MSASQVKNQPSIVDFGLFLVLFFASVDAQRAQQSHIQRLRSSCRRAKNRFASAASTFTLLLFFAMPRSRVF